MNVSCEQSDFCTVVTIEGDLCVPESDQFREFILARIDKGTRDFLIDFRSVPYIDSAGISAILTLLQAARKRGGDIRLAGTNPRITDLFRQVGLHHVFRRFDSREEGVASFEQLNNLEIA